MGKWMKSRGERGQSLVEAAISFPIILLLLSGLVDLGRIYFTWVALEDAAAEGALYLSLHPEWPTSADCADPRNAMWRVTNSSSDPGNLVVDWTRPGIVVNHSVPTAAVGQSVFIEIRYPFYLVTPIIQQIAGGNLTLSVRASHTILTNVRATCP